MPAIQPARLKLQVELLLEKFGSAEDFVNSIKGFFEFYADRTKRSGRGGPIYSTMQSYKIPLQVTKQLERTLQPIAASQPGQALRIADALWNENWYECRVLAFSILGFLPPIPPEIIVDRINLWGEECRKDHLLGSALSKAMVKLWREKPLVFFDLLDSWVDSSKQEFQILVLRIIPSLLYDPDFNYLPRVYQYLTTYVQRVGRVPGHELVEITRILARKSPRETSYFLKRNLTISGNPGVYALIRKSLDAFPTDIGNDLKSFLHDQREMWDEPQ